MIEFALLNWKWLTGAIASALLSIALVAARIEISDLEKAATETALAIQTQKTDAAVILGVAEAHAKEVEIKNVALNAELEDAYAKDNLEIAERDRRIASLVAANGGLRDKAGRCGSGSGDGVPTGASAAGLSPAPTDGPGCRLSEGVSENLRSNARSASAVTDFARKCLDFARRCARP